MAVLAALGAARPGPAGLAVVDGAGPLAAGGRDGRRGGGGRVAAAPGGLPAGLGAVPAPAGGGERLAAGRAGPYRYAIVTRRGFGRGRRLGLVRVSWAAFLR